MFELGVFDTGIQMAEAYVATYGYKEGKEIAVRLSKENYHLNNEFFNEALRYFEEV